MPIYHKPVRLLMRDEMIPAFALSPGQPFTKQQALDWFTTHYPKIKKGTVTAHLSALSINARSRIHHNPSPGEDDLFYQIDGSHFRLYDPVRDGEPIYRAGDTPTSRPPAEEDEGEPEGATEFAYEADLRNYLAKNLAVIEPGLKLYDAGEGITGIEFPVGGRFIDILAVAANGDFVVIELKVSRGYDRVVGQLLRYMAWIGKNQAVAGQQVRGVVVAREISEDLLLACSLLPDVRLLEYQMSLALKPVGLGRDN